MKIFLCEQGGPEWLDLHRGVPSAGRFRRILTPKRAKLAAPAALDNFIAELIAETHRLGERPPRYLNHFMRQGLAMEPEARRWYEMERGLNVSQVGFILTDDGRFGCSPDGLVGEEGGLELKCPDAKGHAIHLMKGVIPAEYLPQMHGCLIVTERKWWDFLSYCPGLPPLLLRATPDEYTDKLRRALEIFWARYQARLKQLNAL